MKIVFSSDFHLGLKTGEMDRTKEIISLMAQIVRHCANLKDDGEEVVLVFGGDIFNTNVPSEHLISEFIKVLNLIRKNDIETYVMVGNHDAIADPNRLSCLSFVKRIGKAYPSISLVEDIQFMKIGTFDTGPLCFTFLPHITKALIQSKLNSGKLKKEISTQAYIDDKCEKVLDKVGGYSQHLVFSHLNVRNVHGGSEENLLRKSEVYLPNIFLNVPLGFSKPAIINGHIHSRTKIGNVDIVGSPLFCSFGEAETDKYFLEIDYHGNLGKEPVFKYIKTKCVQFKQMEVDMVSDNKRFMERDDVNDFLDDIADKNVVAKFNVIISPENNTYDWKAIRDEIISETGATVREIVPRVVLKRPVKSIKQVASLNSDEAIKVYLKKNIGKKDIPRLKRLYKRSMKYTGGALNAT